MDWTLSDYANYDIGIKGKDKGQGGRTKEKWNEHKFRNSPLLDIGHRAPYMHDGSLPDLESVIEFYDRGGDEKRVTRSPDVKQLELTAQEKAQLLAFLKALTAPLPIVEPPPLPE
ncbi:MAG: hypothetical protein EOO38_23405 [Cytophagaceae bacterium]|nr:MAG: hypothetical protein EOO38_23405 [Cytophagaceae bacterium]